MLLVNVQNQDHKASGVGEVLSKNVFIIYRRGGHLGQCGPDYLHKRSFPFP